MFNVDTKNKIDVKNDLNISFKKNVIAIDYIFNLIRETEDKLKYKEDNVLIEDLNTLKYINFCLYYLDKQYMEAYKKLGGKISDLYE